SMTFRMECDTLLTKANWKATGIRLERLHPGNEADMRAVIAVLAFTAMVTPAEQAPSGWRVRVDRSTSASDPDAPGPVKFVIDGTAFHATNPQAAIFWNPANTIGGSYSLTGTFTLLAPSNHTNYYGLLFGGSDLVGGAQRYLY